MHRKIFTKSAAASILIAVIVGIDAWLRNRNTESILPIGVIVAFYAFLGFVIAFTIVSLLLIAFTPKTAHRTRSAAIIITCAFFLLIILFLVGFI